MDSFLESIVIKPKKKRKCNICEKDFKSRVGELYCKKCIPKLAKLDNGYIYIVNYTGSADG